MTWHKHDPQEPLRVRYRRESQNSKTGPIPVSSSSPSTCPQSCAWYGSGCYGESGYIAGRWKKIPFEGMTWDQFCSEISALPPGQLWRHNEVGDLPGHDELVREDLLLQLIRANRGKRGFTFSHKKQRLDLIEMANAQGLTINISCDNQGEVDRYLRAGIKAPLALVVPDFEAKKHWRTSYGGHVIICPAQHADVNCQQCGLCAMRDRKTIIAFKAHQAINIVSQKSIQYRLPLVQ